MLATNGIQVADVIGDVLYLQGVESQPQFLEIVFCLLEQCAGKGHLVFIELLRGQAGHHTAEIAFKGLFGNVSDLVLLLADQPFNGVVDAWFVAGDLDVGDAGDVEWNSPFGISVFDAQVDGHVAEIESHDLLEHGDAQRAAATHGAVANLLAGSDASTQAREDQYLTGLADVIELPQKSHEGPCTGGTCQTNCDEHQRSPVDDKVASRSIPRISFTCWKNWRTTT